MTPGLAGRARIGYPWDPRTETRVMRAARTLLALALAVACASAVYAYYRANYGHAKRLRVVTPGRFYRSGQLTASGFAEAFSKYDIRTVVNLQEEARDPLLPAGYLGDPGERESEVCARLGVKYVSLDGGVLESHGTTAEPKLLTDYYRVLDDESNYPILIHCKAGLHRTGFLTAIYRMDRERRDKADAVRELRGNGFGTFAATDANLYVKRYLLDYQPRPERHP